MLNFRFGLVRLCSVRSVWFGLFGQYYCLFLECVNKIIPRKRQNLVLSMRGSPVIYHFFYSFPAALLFVRRRTRRPYSMLTHCLINSCGVLRCSKIHKRRLEKFDSWILDCFCKKTKMFNISNMILLGKKMQVADKIGRKIYSNYLQLKNIRTTSPAFQLHCSF